MDEIKLDNTKSISLDEFLDSPPDVLFVSCFEVEHNILDLFFTLNNTKTKLAYYNGNDYTGYRWDYVKNYLHADESTHNVASRSCSHIVKYWPWVDYDAFVFSEPCFTPVLRTYINTYEKLFPNSYLIMESCRGYIKNVDIEVIDGRPKDETVKLMASSIGTMHIKELEGYGYAVLESMAAGRPVFLYRPYMAGRTLLNWSVEGDTCFTFGTLAEYAEKFQSYVSSKDQCASIQESCSKRIREIVNNEEQTNKLKQFLDNLI